MKLSVKGVAFTWAIMWEMIVIWSFMLMFLGKGMAPFELINQFYLGWLSPTPVGLIIGIVVGFVDAFIAGLIAALIYNKIVTCCAK